MVVKDSTYACLKVAALNFISLCEILIINNNICLSLRKTGWYVTNASFPQRLENRGKLDCIVFKTHDVPTALTHAFPELGCGKIMRV